MLACQKHLFDLDPEVHYINGGYMSPLLRSVVEAGLESVRLKARPNRIRPEDFFIQTEILRALFARLVNARSPDEAALIPSASYGIAAVAKNAPARRGQNIVIAETQFPSNVYAWMALAEEKGLEIRTAAMPTERLDRGRIWNERILEAIDADTALVALGHIHWANGIVFDLKRIGEKAHAQGALLVVDGTQSVGAMPMDVQALGIDALVCAGYKWLMGPYSYSYMWLGEALIKGRPLEENWANRLNSERFGALTEYETNYQPGARRFDMGERSNFIFMPMCIAALEQILEWDPVHIQDYCRRLMSPFIPLWQERGFHVADEHQRSQHLFGVELPAHVDLQTLQSRMTEARVSVSYRGRFIRVSPHVYNDETDIAALTRIFASF